VAPSSASAPGSGAWCAEPPERATRRNKNKDSPVDLVVQAGELVLAVLLDAKFHIAFYRASRL
jgi:hypothetical protein